MRMVLKIAAGIFLGLFAFAIVMGVLANIAQHRAMEDFNKEMSRIAADPDPLGLRRSTVQKGPAAHVGEKLPYGDDCVAGTVVRRSLQNGVPTAVQVLENYRPVACAGDHRL